jgi:hypothetical protein
VPNKRINLTVLRTSGYPPSDAPTRVAVAAVHLAAPGWLHISEPGGSRQVGRGQRRREAVGASGRRRGDAACWGPLARPITRLEPTALIAFGASPAQLRAAAQPPPR